jgi:hypothetical protein
MALDTNTDTEKNEQVAFLVALAHGERVLLERMALATTNNQ